MYEQHTRHYAPDRESHPQQAHLAGDIAGQAPRAVMRHTQYSRQGREPRARAMASEQRHRHKEFGGKEQNKMMCPGNRRHHKGDCTRQSQNGHAADRVRVRVPSGRSKTIPESVPLRW